MSEFNHILRSPDCLVIGGSAGAFELIYEWVSLLPEDFPHPVIVILHRGKGFKSNLKQLLQSKAAVKVKEADEKESLKPGWVYLAPVNFHLLIEPELTLSLDASEPVLYSRPSIDVTFKSAVDVFGDKLMAMVFSGANADSAAGSEQIVKKGGQVLIHDPEEAEVPTMPEATVKKMKHPILFRRADFGAIIEQLMGAAKSRKK